MDKDSYEKAYEEVGRKLAEVTGMVARSVFNDAANRAGLLEETLWDIMITHHNGQDVSAMLRNKEDEIKELIGWEEEYV